MPADPSSDASSLRYIRPAVMTSRIFEIRLWKDQWHASILDIGYWIARRRYKSYLQYIYEAHIGGDPFSSGMTRPVSGTVNLDCLLSEDDPEVHSLLFPKGIGYSGKWRLEILLLIATGKGQQRDDC